MNDGPPTQPTDAEPTPSHHADPAPGRLVHIETRKVPVPPHRFSPIKAAWPKIYPPLCEHLQLQVRMNIKNKAVELRNSRVTTDPGALQKGEDFLRALTLGFDVDDAIALLRLDDLYVAFYSVGYYGWSADESRYIETFEVKDVKTLQGDHLARAIGRIAGSSGKTKFAIENATRTRVVLAGQKIHILGGFQNIRMARESVVSLVLGARPGKVYQDLRTISARRKERF
jgi:RNA-binding protein PNO1